MTTITDKQLIKNIYSLTLKNFFKIILSLLLVLVCFEVINIPLSLFTVLTTNIVASFLSTVVLYVFIIVFTYGFCVLLKKFYTNNKPIIGDIFAGFKDFPRNLLLTIIIMVAISVVEIIAFIPFFALILKNFDPSLYQFTDNSLELGMAIIINNLLYITCTAMLAAFLFLCLSLPYSMIFPVMIDNRTLSLKLALRKSRELLKKQVFKYLWFCIKAIFPIWAIAIGLTLLIVSFGITKISFLSLILFIADFLVIFYFLICTSLCPIAYYTKLTTPQYEQISCDSENAIQLEQPQIEETTGEDPCLSLTDTPTEL